MERKINMYKNREISFSSVMDSYHGWQAYACWGNTYKKREEIKEKIIDVLWDIV